MSKEIYTIERIYVDSDYNSNPVTVYATENKSLAESYCIRANDVVNKLANFYLKKVKEINGFEYTPVYNEHIDEEQTFIDKRKWFKNISFEVHIAPILNKKHIIKH